MVLNFSYNDLEWYAKLLAYNVFKNLLLVTTVFQSQNCCLAVIHRNYGTEKVVKEWTFFTTVRPKKSLKSNFCRRSFGGTTKVIKG